MALIHEKGVIPKISLAASTIYSFLAPLAKLLFAGNSEWLSESLMSCLGSV
jgi:hypothetical protein